MPSVPKFEPTADEWVDPIAYLSSKLPEALPYGMSAKTHSPSLRRAPWSQFAHVMRIRTHRHRRNAHSATARLGAAHQAELWLQVPASDTDVPAAAIQ